MEQGGVGNSSAGDGLCPLCGLWRCDALRTQPVGELDFSVTVSVVAADPRSRG